MLICLHSSKGYDAIFATKVYLSYKGVYGTPANIFISCIFNEIPILCLVYFILKSYTISRQLFKKHTMNEITSLWNITIFHWILIPNTLSWKYQIVWDTDIIVVQNQSNFFLYLLLLLNIFHYEIFLLLIGWIA